MFVAPLTILSPLNTSLEHQRERNRLIKHFRHLQLLLGTEQHCDRLNPRSPSCTKPFTASVMELVTTVSAVWPEQRKCQACKPSGFHCRSLPQVSSDLATHGLLGQLQSVPEQCANEPDCWTGGKEPAERRAAGLETTNAALFGANSKSPSPHSESWRSFFKG